MLKNEAILSNQQLKKSAFLEKKSGFLLIYFCTLFAQTEFFATRAPSLNRW